MFCNEPMGSSSLQPPKQVLLQLKLAIIPVRHTCMKRGLLQHAAPTNTQHHKAARWTAMRAPARLCKVHRRRSSSIRSQRLLVWHHERTAWGPWHCHACLMLLLLLCPGLHCAVPLRKVPRPTTLHGACTTATSSSYARTARAGSRHWGEHLHGRCAICLLIPLSSRRSAASAQPRVVSCRWGHSRGQQGRCLGTNAAIR